MYSVRTTTYYVFEGLAAGAAPSPDRLVLSDPTSSCLAYGDFVALRSTACGRPCVVRFIISC